MPSEQRRHRIRLRTAWEPPALVGRSVRLVRLFGRPSGLAPGDRVLMTIVGATIGAAIRLNGELLPPIGRGERCWQHDISRLLRDRNELSLDVAAGDLAEERAGGSPGRTVPPAAIGSVAIEIVPAE